MGHIKLRKQADLKPAVLKHLVREAVQLNRERGMTMVMVTHEMAFARKVSDRVIFMHQGRVHEMGPPDKLFGSPETPELQQFLDDLAQAITSWGLDYNAG